MYKFVFLDSKPIGFIRQVTPGVFTAYITPDHRGTLNCSSSSMDGCERFVRQFVPNATFKETP